MNNILNEIKREMGASNMEDAELLEMAEYFDNLTQHDLDSMNNAEYAEYMEYMDSLEHAVGRHGRFRVHKAKQKGGHGKHAAHSSFKKDKLSAVGGGGRFAPDNSVNKNAPNFGSKAFINEQMINSKGDLNITVIRPTANIVGIPLPYVLFDLNGYTSSYVSTLKQYLPAGVTVAATADPSTGDVLLTYTAPGPLVDIVRITLTGSPISYSEFLQSMNSNFFKTRYIRQEYPNDSTLLLQTSQTINFGLLSALGMKNQNALLPRSRRMADDYNTYIINLFLPEQKITSDFSFVQNILAVAGQTIAWDVTMSARVNLNNI